MKKQVREPLTLQTVRVEQHAVRNGTVYVFLTTINGVEVFRCSESKRLDNLNKEMAAIVSGNLRWLPVLSNGKPFVFPSIRDAAFWVDQL